MRPSWGAGAAFCFVLLSWASGPSPVKMEYNLGFWPPQLSKAEGENATFVCNVSRELMTSILNWYKEKNGSQPEKLAAYPKDKPSSPLQDRYHIAKRNGQTYEMTIVGLQLNDSGRYFCGIINFQMPPVKESGWSELNVTERLMDSTTPTPFTTPEALEKFPRIIVVVSIIVGAVLVLLLLCWVLFIVESRGRGGAGNSESDKDSLKVERCAASGSASAVVYGQLDFQRPEAPPAGGAECCEQTEYAIIVFPPDKPGGSPHRK
ncbi:programmed cell death protein 1 [Monodelphis domestica]|nr:programmed cell death protein 1 [Monodelphis domestica]